MEKSGGGDHTSTTSTSDGALQGRICSPAASLIKSAARSILDEGSPSTIVSDGSDNCSAADGASASAFRAPSSPTLRSLQTKRIPAIPDEQDRRRFIGCLAAILASCYDYDEADDSLDKDDDLLQQFHETQFDDEEDFQKNMIFYSRSSLSDSFEGAIEQHEKNHWPKQPSKASLNSSSRQSGWRRSATEKIRIARQRHRKRRYDLYCKFLLSSSEHLLLDKSVARAFLPMLSRIFLPQEQSQAKEHSNAKRRSRSAPSSPSMMPDLDMPSNLSFSGEVNKHEPTAGRRNNTTPEASRKQGPLCIFQEVDKDDLLKPFLESMEPGSGFRCLSLLLLQHLLSSDVGYDARIRHAVKKLGVVVLFYDMENDPVERTISSGKEMTECEIYQSKVRQATRKFESLEHSIARRLLRLSEPKRDIREKSNGNLGGKGKIAANGFTRDQIVRGVKIGSAGIVAGTLFALTGGLAAPGIAAGVAAVAGSAAATAAVVTLTSTAVVTTIFGVGGGSLAAYKMQRRTQGLTEFEFQKETNGHLTSEQIRFNESKSDVEAELYTTICFSGWLRDKHDFQRPWGIQPTRPRLRNRLELLERFYSVYRPDHVPKCSKILASWKGEENKLWDILRKKYGRDPDQLFPLEDGPRFEGSMTLQQEEVLDQIFVELGYISVAPEQSGNPSEGQQTPFERMKRGWKDGRYRSLGQLSNISSMRRMDSLHGPSSSNDVSAINTRNRFTEISQSTASKSEGGLETQADGAGYEPPEHLATVWDYKTTYGGELYTVRWESELLKTICDCVADLAFDVVSGATRQILKQTILSTLLAAVVWPSYLLNLANMIDGDWTLAVERADEAGREMAKTLLYCRSGRRPVTLVGFSFGARVIYSCLKELALLQEEWEDYQEMKPELGFTRTDERHFTRLRDKFEGKREPASVVEDAIVMGLPNHLSPLSWKACRQVVAGRIVNCYSSNDLILSLMFQAKRFSGGSLNNGVGSILKPVCGTCPVIEKGIENVDVSDLVSGHQDYCLVTRKILERIQHGQPLRHAVSVDDDCEVSEN